MTNELGSSPDFGGSQKITDFMVTMENALECARRGWPVLLLHSVVKDECTCGKPECTSPGKHPRTSHGVKDATTDEEVIRDWFRKYPESNYGIATGKESGLLVLDIDPLHYGEEYLEDLETKNGKLPETLTVLTGSGGRHLYFQYPHFPVGNSPLCTGVDIRGDGGYVVGPGSVHKSGRTYEWEVVI